ncbi:hypothetical protein FGO68_gene7758 [Halteria grandinella]|uniref:Uncharacterized protein n=1 Tax=Halteria grandinella TaxID=5974 RepID=A0A8J8NDL2_HALGN|nr:hypothetical protein FGO68_gene7758 [Halteria grandinella]
MRVRKRALRQLLIIKDHKQQQITAAYPLRVNAWQTSTYLSRGRRRLKSRMQRRKVRTSRVMQRFRKRAQQTIRCFQKQEPK